MTSPRETVSVNAAKIACFGDKDSPHPRVFLAMTTKGFVDCPYCGNRYVAKNGAAVEESH